jgi:hypothetical protein
MSKKQLGYTKPQLDALIILRRILLGTILFVFLLLVFAAIIVAILYSAFSGKGDAKLILSLVGLDGLIGWSIRHMVIYLFPHPPNTKNKDS